MPYQEVGKPDDRDWQYIWPCHFSELQADGLVLVRMRRIVDMWYEASFTDLGIRPGKKVSRGDIIAYVNGDKMSADLICPCAGTITQVLISDGQAVGIGDPLFVIEPDLPLSSLYADPNFWGHFEAIPEIAGHDP